MDLNPTTAGADEVLSLLAVISDPKKHAQRLDELVAQEKATDEKIAVLNEMAADTRRLHSAAEALTIVLNKRKTALDTREAELNTRAQALELTEATRSHEALQRREAACQAREEAVTQEERRLATAKVDLESKQASIRGLADTLHH
jgi:hypothetical protein